MISSKCSNIFGIIEMSAYSFCWFYGPIKKISIIPNVANKFQTRQKEGEYIMTILTFALASMVGCAVSNGQWGVDKYIRVQACDAADDCDPTFDDRA